MDPVNIADLVLEMAAGLFVVFVFAAFGVFTTPTKMSRNLPDRCFADSYEGTSIVAFSFVFFALVSLGCAYSIKHLYKRHVDGNAKINSSTEWTLVYALIPSASITYILAFSLFLIINQYKLGKIRCWSLITQIFLFGACIGAIVGGLIFCIICYVYGRGGVDALPILDANGSRGANLDGVNSKDADPDDLGV